ncbi:hypothetical protein Naga_100636g4, partial [Nannochloropsis gaditana]
MTSTATTLATCAHQPPTSYTPVTAFTDFETSGGEAAGPWGEGAEQQHFPDDCGSESSTALRASHAPSQPTAPQEISSKGRTTTDDNSVATASHVASSSLPSTASVNNPNDHEEGPQQEPIARPHGHSDTGPLDSDSCASRTSSTSADLVSDVHVPPAVLEKLLRRLECLEAQMGRRQRREEEETPCSHSRRARPQRPRLHDPSRSSFGARLASRPLSLQTADSFLELQSATVRAKNVGRSHPAWPLLRSLDTIDLPDSARNSPTHSTASSSRSTGSGRFGAGGEAGGEEGSEGDGEKKCMLSSSSSSSHSEEAEEEEEEEQADVVEEEEEEEELEEEEEEEEVEVEEKEEEEEKVRITSFVQKEEEIRERMEEEVGKEEGTKEATGVQESETTLKEADTGIGGGLGLVEGSVEWRQRRRKLSLPEGLLGKAGPALAKARRDVAPLGGAEQGVGKEKEARKPAAGGTDVANKGGAAVADAPCRYTRTEEGGKDEGKGIYPVAQDTATLCPLPPIPSSSSSSPLPRPGEAPPPSLPPSSLSTTRRRRSNSTHSDTIRHRRHHHHHSLACKGGAALLSPPSTPTHSSSTGSWPGLPPAATRGKAAFSLLPSLPASLQSFRVYVWHEVFGAQHYYGNDEDAAEVTAKADGVVQNFLHVPAQLEECLAFGLVVCIDAFLYALTVLPLRVTAALGRLLTARYG